MPEIVPVAATATPESRDRGHTTQKQTSKGTRLRQAGMIAGLCEKALVEMSGTLSFSDSENARGNAQALASVARAWQASVEEMRIAKGEPLPGSRKPAPDQAKPKRRGNSALPPRVGGTIAMPTPAKPVIEQSIPPVVGQPEKAE